MSCILSMTTTALLNFLLLIMYQSLCLIAAYEAIRPARSRIKYCSLFLVSLITIAFDLW